MAEQLAEAGPVEAGGYTVIHNGIDLERYRREEVGARPSPLPAGRRILGTVGSLTREKGTRTCWRPQRRCGPTASPT